MYFYEEKKKVQGINKVNPTPLFILIYYPLNESNNLRNDEIIL